MPMLLIIQWVFTTTMIGLSFLIALSQWYAIYAIPKTLNEHGEPRNYSMILLVGGLLGAIGCFFSPSTVLNHYWWLPLLLDPGCALMFGLTASFLIFSYLKHLAGFDNKDS